MVKVVQKKNLIYIALTTNNGQWCIDQVSLSTLFCLYKPHHPPSLLLKAALQIICIITILQQLSCSNKEILDGYGHISSYNHLHPPLSCYSLLLSFLQTEEQKPQTNTQTAPRFNGLALHRRNTSVILQRSQHLLLPQAKQVHSFRFFSL